MSYLAHPAQKFIAVSFFSSASVETTHGNLAKPLETRPSVLRKIFASTLAAALFLFLAGTGIAHAQTATVNWTDVHQVIDGFGASDAFTASYSGTLSSAQQAFFFGTGSGQLGLSLLRVAVTNNDAANAGSCTSVSSSCAGQSQYISDMQAVIANGGKVYATAFSPPPAYETNGSADCSSGSGSGALATADYASYATWLANFVQSLQTEDSISLYAISVQNEPDQCQPYDSSIWSGANIDTFVKTNLGPTFSADGLSTLVFVPEGGSYSASTSLGATCGADSSCNQYVSGFNWHDYDASLSGTNTVDADPYPTDWPSGKKYWETEASCGPNYGPYFCQGGFHPDITNALNWGAIIDQRIAVDGANAWLYWLLADYNRAGGAATDTDESLMANSAGDGAVPLRAYVLGQYSKFVRPGYYRIDATHLPQSGVSVSAYQNAATNTLVVIATNYTGSSVSQTFGITNAPSFTAMTPTVTSANLSLAAQPKVSVKSNSFTYTLPAQSITTFVSGSSSGPPAPSNLSGTVVQ